MPDLAMSSCVPCRGRVPPLTPDEIASFHEQVEGWEVVDHHHLRKRWETPNFADALALANRFGEIAETEGHHPEFGLGWGWIEARVWTHKIDGLTLSDFVLAAKFDRAAGRG